MSARSLLVRGMLVGIVAGLLAFCFGWLFGEGPIDSAIAFESGHAAGGDEPELVSRSVQSTLGLGVAVLLYGTAVGGVFGLLFAIVWGRVVTASARVVSATLAAVGFVSVFLVPFLKYPANPPAVGSAETVGRRSVLYILMVLISISAAVAATLVRRSLLPRRGPWDATLIAAGTFVVIVGAAAAVLPVVNEVPEHFPATALWHFRVASLGIQVVLWTALGVGFGVLTERAERLRTIGAQRATPR